MLFKPLQEKKGDFNVSEESSGRDRIRSFELRQNENSREKRVARDLFGGIHVVEDTSSKMSFESQNAGKSGLNQWFDSQGSASKRVKFTAIENKQLDPEDAMLEDPTVTEYMDIESTETPSYADKENIRGASFLAQEQKNDGTPYKLSRKDHIESTSHKKNAVTESNKKPEEFVRPARIKRSLIQ